jgi:hypothetical protein
MRVQGVVQPAKIGVSAARSKTTKTITGLTQGHRRLQVTRQCHNRPSSLSYSTQLASSQCVLHRTLHAWGPHPRGWRVVHIEHHARSQDSSAHRVTSQPPVCRRVRHNPPWAAWRMAAARPARTCLPAAHNAAHLMWSCWQSPCQGPPGRRRATPGG